MATKAKQKIQQVNGVVNGSVISPEKETFENNNPPVTLDSILLEPVGKDNDRGAKITQPQLANGTNHVLDDSETAKEWDLDPTVKTCSVPRHQKALLEWFCEECREFVCQACIDLHHKSHRCINMKNPSHVETVTQSILQSAEMVGREIEKYRGIVIKIQENGRLRDDEIEKVKHDVKSCVDNWIEQIREQENKILNDIETTQKNHQENDNSQVSEIEKHLETMKTALRDTEKLASDVSSIRQVTSKGCALSRNENLLTTDLNIETKPSRGYHQFIPNRHLTTIIDSGGVGSLLDCVAEGDGLKRATVGLKSSFIISTVAVRGTSKLTHYNPDLSVDVKVRCSHEDISSVIHDNKDGTYSVSFVPVHPGEHTIAISLNGQQTLESPYTVLVRKCVVTCEKLIKGTVGLENSFTVAFCDSSTQSMYDPATELRVEINSPQGTVDSVILDNKDGTYNASFIPADAQENQLVITVDGQQIPASPFIVKVRKCVLTGDGVKLGKVGLKSHFKITFCDKADEIVYDPTTRLKVKIQHSQGAVIPSNIRDDKNGTYSVSFYPLQHGNHKVTITVQMMYSEQEREKQSESNQQEVPGSPFEVTVKPREYRPVLKFGKKGTKKGEFSWPSGVAVNKKEELIIADCGNHRVQMFNSKGEHLRTIGKRGAGAGEFIKPSGVVLNKDNNIIVLDKGNSRLQIFSETGTFLRSFGSKGRENGQMENPQGISLDRDGNIVVTDTGNYRIQVFTNEGKWLLAFDCHNARHCVSHGGHYYVSTASENCIKVFDKSGIFVCKHGARGSSPGAFDWPTGLAVDKAAHLVVCDTSNGRVQVLEMDGTFVGSFGARGEGNVQFNYPACVAAMGDGRLVVCDARNNTIHIFK